MNNTFHLRRFGLYARKEIRENWIALVLALIALIAMIGYAVFQTWESLLVNGYDHRPIHTHTSLVISNGLATWVMGAYMLRSMTTKNRAIANLTLPVSNFERFLWAWLITVPLMMLMSYIVWKCGWTMAFSLMKNRFPSLKTSFSSDSLEGFQYIFTLAGGAAFMLGATTLGKLNTLKTLALWIGFLWVLLGALTPGLLRQMIREITEIQMIAPVPWIPPTVRFIVNKIGYYDLHSAYEWVYFGWWVYCLPVVLWIATYLKIKEKEV